MKDKEKSFEKAQMEVKQHKTEVEIKKDIEENYKIGIEYYEDVEKNKN